ncbi:zinc metalloproteinase dpy-31 isoform X1 [Lingula anatina]|uniref:Metalloendopeptidase n=1 Tax=Lingula anatina TaxID=7574 RepID=A0A1S3JW52_LINAN|nr:zinc metalloproteinase dpy-31 isoform X1 [Lingula anatina]|eukprot:XP_013414655.1 zinc metalloproteinase dpy-31 isoform X1 [Lingula anatina]
MKSKTLTNHFIIWLLLGYAITEALFDEEHSDESSARLILQSAKAAIAGALNKRKTVHIRSLRRAVARERADSSTVPELADGSVIAEFDILLTPEQDEARHRTRFSRKAVRSRRYRWPQGIVPYEIDSTVDALSTRARAIIRQAFAHWQAHTCLRFEEYDRTKHYATHRSDRLVFVKGSWCASKLGRIGGRQPLYLARGCLKKGTIIHELGHTIGWIHEQSRPDRDQYVTIDLDRVSYTYKDQYAKEPSSFVDTYNVPYDYYSIMHYPSSGEIITKDRRAQNAIGQREGLSFYDAKLANIMYSCSAQCPSTVRCAAPGFVGQNCECICKDGSDSCTLGSTVITTTTQRPTPKPKPTPTTPPIQPPAVIPKIDYCGWYVYDQKYIKGDNNDQLNEVSLAQCKEACASARTFHCRSLDYYKSKRKCFLSEKTYQDQGSHFATDSRMIHYQRRPCSATDEPPVATTTPVTNTPPASATCEAGWHGFTVGGATYCFLIVNEASIYLQAKRSCERRNGNLISGQSPSSPILSMIEDGRLSASSYWLKNDQLGFLGFLFSDCEYLSLQGGQASIEEKSCTARIPYVCEREGY